MFLPFFSPISPHLHSSVHTFSSSYSVFQILSSFSSPPHYLCFFSSVLPGLFPPLSFFLSLKLFSLLLPHPYLSSSTFHSFSSPHPLLPLTHLHPPTPSSKYRPTSEQHNDNFSLSTIAEGSHPNVRKLCDTPPNVPHARALAYYDNIICQVTWFSPLSLSHPFFLHLPRKPCPGPLTPLPLTHGHEYSLIL